MGCWDIAHLGEMFSLLPTPPVCKIGPTGGENNLRFSSPKAVHFCSSVEESKCRHVIVTALCFIYWIGQKVRSGFHTMLQTNPNELFGQSNNIEIRGKVI